jgi:hypothetical protein
MSPYSAEALRAARDRHEPWLRSQSGVVGTGIGLGPDGEPCIKVYSNRIPPAVRNAIMDRLRDLPVVIEETGEIRKQGPV